MPANHRARPAVVGGITTVVLPVEVIGALMSAARKWVTVEFLASMLTSVSALAAEVSVVGECVSAGHYATTRPASRHWG